MSPARAIVRYPNKRNTDPIRLLGRFNYSGSPRGRRPRDVHARRFSVEGSDWISHGYTRKRNSPRKFARCALCILSPSFAPGIDEAVERRFKGEAAPLSVREKRRDNE